MNANPKSHWNALMMLTLNTLIVSCSSVGLKTNDFIFVVSGVVHDVQALPLAGVAVIMDLEDTAFDGITPIKQVKSVTDLNGAFTFALTVQRNGVPYKLTCRKEGYENHSVSDIAPPSKRHQITLRRPVGGHRMSPNIIAPVVSLSLY